MGLQETINFARNFAVMVRIRGPVDIPVSALSLQSLIEVSFVSAEDGWEIGWFLASYSNDSQQGNFAMGGSSSASLVCNSMTTMAILGVSLSIKDLLDIPVYSMNKRGEFLLAFGSPFGVLSPTHFFNSQNLLSSLLCLICLSLLWRMTTKKARVRTLPSLSLKERTPVALLKLEKPNAF